MATQRWLSTTSWLVFGSRELLAKWPCDAADGMLAQIIDSVALWNYQNCPCVVLNDEPLDTALIETPGGIAFVRWGGADSSHDLLQAARHTLAHELFDTVGSFVIAHGDYVLFDALMGDCSDTAFEPIAVALPAGAYTLSTARISAGAQGEVISLIRAR
jgi:hypothetical protein